MIEYFYLTHRSNPNRVDLGVMAMKRYSAFSKAPELAPYINMMSCFFYSKPGLPSFFFF